VPTWLKALVWAVVTAAAVVALFLWVFPWVEGWQQDPTLGDAGVHAVRASR